MTPRTLAQDEVLFSQGDAAEYFYVITHGELEIVSQLSALHKSRAPPSAGQWSGSVVQRRLVGDTVGELALVYGHILIATARAVAEGTVVYALSRPVFRRLALLASVRHRATATAFVDAVPALNQLTADQRELLAGRLSAVSFEAGQPITQ
eukprot:CAMPEP_0175819682 /NCGR_PEP_ID=MMETSP0107_2-20121207/8198_1 /TAXON_ID=195067 ORGANISM="Goniomonas pacifica, Strain CCMP1869" /NCGR_SAMPLE_ID=MMETSP0107_2 /ASSEMBLY_ACC=CAM_ASM_000203 /LENGTH=150 /DNA_ID=CAMNT_0017131943 /DNA_START=5 /DNA_END=454 /DNA_ORIENTATION=+